VSSVGKQLATFVAVVANALRLRRFRSQPGDAAMAAAAPADRGLVEVS
jgi:hypothetical protein